MARRKRSKLPKWRLKANWLLRELARIWYGKVEPYPLFKDKNFIKAFTDIMVQFFLDCYDTEDKAWFRLESIIEALTIMGSLPISYPTQACQAQEVIIRMSLLFHKKPFLNARIITDILWMAHQIESRLKSGHTPPYKRLKRIRELSWYENLPCLPID